MIRFFKRLKEYNNLGEYKTSIIVKEKEMRNGDTITTYTPCVVEHPINGSKICMVDYGDEVCLSFGLDYLETPSLEEAKKYIDRYIQDEKERRSKEVVGKKISYIKYP